MMKVTPVRTEYFSEDIVRDAVGGCCHDFAFAVHRRTGWPIGCLWKDPIVDEYTLSRHPMPIHLFCVTPDGRAVDAEGLTDLAELPRHRIERHGTEAQWARVAEEEHYAARLAPREYRIEAAEKVIAGSDRFLALLEEMRAERVPSP